MNDNEKKTKQRAVRRDWPMPNCKICKSKLSYNERYDVRFCPKCNIWLEDNCGDTDCFYCANRPEKPDSSGINLCQEKVDMNLSQLADLSNEFGHMDDKLQDRLYKKKTLKKSEQLKKAWPKYFDHEE